ncbi:MAG: hypothetical protein JST12_19435 [Armatimonadetes bacterium]|nr:hypothetical protein [Armatimonadota bacterium]
MPILFPIAAVAIDLSNAQRASLEAATGKFKKFAIAKDLDGLKTVCAKKIECQEIVRLTPKELPVSMGTFFGAKESDSDLHIGYQIKREIIDMRAPSKFQRQIILGFCDWVQASSQVHGWIDIRREAGDDRYDLIPFPGMGLTGKYASNAVWRVDFELQNGKWLATKLITGSR